MKHSLELLTTDRAWVLQTILENRRQLMRLSLPVIIRKIQMLGGRYLQGTTKAPAVDDLLVLLWGLQNVSEALNWSKKS